MELEKLQQAKDIEKNLLLAYEHRKKVEEALKTIQERKEQRKVNASAALPKLRLGYNNMNPFLDLENEFMPIEIETFLRLYLANLSNEIADGEKELLAL